MRLSPFPPPHHYLSPLPSLICSTFGEKKVVSCVPQALTCLELNTNTGSVHSVLLSVQTLLTLWKLTRHFPNGDAGNFSQNLLIVIKATSDPSRCHHERTCVRKIPSDFHAILTVSGSSVHFYGKARNLSHSNGTSQEFHGLPSS